jgi:hypothetical protein
MKLNPIVIAVALCCLGASVHADETRRPYIVQLGDKPVATYGGGITGYPATRPAAGQRLDLSAPNVQLYAQYLAERQASVMAVVASAPVQYQYQLALNGFSAMLTDAEVRALKARGDVASVSADGRRHLLTDYTPTFLGLDKPGGLWSQVGGKSRAGEDVVIGVLDTGVWPENPSFSDRVDANGNPSWDSSAALAYTAPPASWKGSCASGEGWEASFCNNKLIGAQYFVKGFQDAIPGLHASEFKSPRDSNGHGTHTATTSGGNSGVEASVHDIVMGKTSGMAPRARLAAYKVCWSGDDNGEQVDGCYGSDSVAAVEQAIRDGVNVLSYSISGGWQLDDPVDQAFLHAANAGIFVSAAAGNEGPKHYSLSHQAPWLTTVAATTHDAQLLSTLTLGSGKQYRGLSLNQTALPQTAIIMAQDAVLPGVDSSTAQLCYSTAYNGGTPQLDPTSVKGKIVVCLRGASPRVDKSAAVKEAGGVGMVLLDDGNGPLAEVHSVPTVHLFQEDRVDVTAYVQGASPKAALSAFAHVTGNVPAPVVARFSSRGPNTADMSVLKPDLAAPGVDILAGVVPAMDQAQHDQVAAGTLKLGPAWDYYSGTSMATPHISGIAALLHQLHPTWTPAAIKSAMMTSASATLPDAFTGHTYAGPMPWAQGAGQIQPNRALDPGLVYDLGAADYARYLCNAGMSAQCVGGAAPSFNLNLPTITVAGAADEQVVTRRVTNVGSTAATYTASASLTGYEVTVSPATLVLAPGASASFNLIMKRVNAKDYEWQFGKLVWSDGSHTVTSQLIAAAGKMVDSPSPVTSEKASGMKALSVYTGYNGKLGAVVGGMKPVTRASYEVAQAPFNSVDTPDQIIAACQAGKPGVRVIPVTLPEKTLAARFELFNRDTGDGGNHDLELALIDAKGASWGLSRLQGSNERITLENPPAGEYRVCVVGNWIANNVSTTFDLSSAIVTAADGNGSLKAMLPTRVYAGQYATVGLSWSALAPQQRYFGAIQFTDGSGKVGGTSSVSIDTTDPVPVAYLSKPAPARRAQ